MRGLLQTGFFWAYGVLVVFLYAGFLGHESARPVVFRYSLGYAAFLLALAAFLALPVAVWSRRRRIQPRPIAFALTPVAVLAIVGWFVASTYYYATQAHDFDPFLQMPPTHFDPASVSSTTQGLRVLTVGGSTTGNYRLAEEDRYPSILETRLRETIPQAEVFNAGMDWWTS